MYKEREMNARYAFERTSNYEKKWRYRWQVDREREIIGTIEQWEREVKGVAEEYLLMNPLEDQCPFTWAFSEDTFKANAGSGMSSTHDTRRQDHRREFRFTNTDTGQQEGNSEARGSTGTY